MVLLNNYLLNVPVGSETQGSYGKLEYTLTVSESGDDDEDAAQTIVLNYDNQAPEFSATLKETDNEIYQSNGTYSVNGNFTEEGNSSGGNQSGFNRIVMYFTRSYVEGNNTRKYLVDPMISGGESGIENRYQYTISDPDKDNLQKEDSLLINTIKKIGIKLDKSVISTQEQHINTTIKIQIKLQWVRWLWVYVIILIILLPDCEQM